MSKREWVSGLTVRFYHGSWSRWFDWPILKVYRFRHSVEGPVTSISIGQLNIHFMHPDKQRGSHGYVSG